SAILPHFWRFSLHVSDFYKMDRTMKKYFLTVLFATTCLTTACSDDVVGVENTCSEDQILNPITNICQPKNTHTPPPPDISGPDDAGHHEDTRPEPPQDTSPNPPQDASP